jgi:Golgi phosphoprotein 3 GPP34
MTPPELLTGRLFLLGYDPRRQRIHGGAYHGYVIRAAALEELRLARSIVDDRGKVRATGQSSPDAAVRADPVLAGVLRDITGSSKPRDWKHWINANARATFVAVRDQLDDRLYVRDEPYRALGLFPAHRTYVRDQSAVDALRAEVERVLGGTGPADPRAAALVTLSAAGELGTVLSWRGRRQHRERIKELSTGPVPPALRKAVRAQQAAVAAAGSS